MGQTEVARANNIARAQAHDALSELEKTTIALCREEQAAAVLAEREACAKVAEAFLDVGGGADEITRTLRGRAAGIAAAIRARE